MDAYSTVFGENYQPQMEKEAGIRSVFKGIGRGLKQTMDQGAATSLRKRRRQANVALNAARNEQQAMFQQAQATLDAAKSKRGLGRLWGNIKGNYLNAKAEGLSDKMGDLNRRINRYDNKLSNNAYYKAHQDKLMARRTARENALSQQAQQKPLNFGDGNTDVHYGTTAPGTISGAQQLPDGIVMNMPNKIPAATSTPTAPAAQVANKALNGGGGSFTTFDNAADTMSGSMGAPAQITTLNKKLQKTAPRKTTGGTGTNTSGQTTVQQAAPANAAGAKEQAKAVASDAMKGAAPAPVKGQPAAPQPTATKGDAAPAQATAPQPTAPKGNGADAPDTTQPTAPQPTAPKKPAKANKSTPPAKPTQPADPDLPPIPQGGAPQGGVPQQGMMTPQGYMPQGMMMPQGYMQPYPFAMQAPQPGMSTSEKLMMAGMLGNLSMPAYMYMMSRNNDE